MDHVIAVDFDGCLCENKYPNIGKANDDAISALRIKKAEQSKIILWTCREGELLEAAVDWCSVRQLTFDAVNDNLPEHIETYANNSRKVFADEYWDDKAVAVKYTAKRKD